MKRKPPIADTCCGWCGKPVNLFDKTHNLDGVTVCDRDDCPGAHAARAREQAEELADDDGTLHQGRLELSLPGDEPPQLPEAAYHDLADDDQAQADPLAVPCRRCHAEAGRKCRDYRGRNKFTCKERGTPPPDRTDLDYEDQCGRQCGLF